jgi:hypothetical protein
MWWRALAIGLLFAIPLADSVYRIPVQASEVADIVQYVGEVAGPSSAFALGLRASRTMLRPMRQLHTKLLLEFAEWRGAGYHAIFRGVHAVLGVLLVLAFVGSARPASSVDLAALACGLAVLLGLHTFTGLFREAYPINHFLVVTLYGWAVLLLSQRETGIGTDLAAAGCVALALLTLETGILVAVVAVAAHVAGWRGVSRRGLALIAGVLLAYVYLRVGYLDIQAPPFAERDTGFGLGVLSAREQVARFGGQRWLLYAYNVASGASSILFSQPTHGTWTLLAAWRAGDINPWMLLQAAASVMTTVVIAAYGFRKQADGRRGWRDPHWLIPAVVIPANAILGYAYAKDEIIAFGGTFYALAFYIAVRALLTRASVDRVAALATMVLACGLVMLWATRVGALHVILREQAFFVRNDWAMYGEHEPAIAALRSEALGVRTIAPRSLPPWVAAWIGER